MQLVLNNKIEKSFPLYKIEGNDNRKILYFKINEKKILPGHFYMLKYNGCQKPFSVSNYDGIKIGFMLENRGEYSKKMLNAKQGEYFGLTGPLGNSFNIDDFDNFLLVGGGIGIAPILFLANYITDKGKNVCLLIGEKNKKNFIYQDDIYNFNKLKNCSTSIYTEDGSVGIKGMVTKNIDDLIEKNNYDSICICGPEAMMKIVIERVRGKTNNIQVCMERYMKCGIGLCGSCVLDDIGLRVCEDGPVFSYYDTLINSKEFANYHRNSNGIIEKF
ncbi:MAG: hypothetical protein KAT05_09120 [Spirochaetes bacterium]|nr:hypothetical protein [Spirochaetota bacterium]